MYRLSDRMKLKLRLVFALVLLTSLVTLPAFPSGRAARVAGRQRAGAAYTAQPVRGASLTAAKSGAAPGATLPAAPQLPLEPTLNDLAGKVTATPNFSGAVIAGQTLNVRLDLPRGGPASRATSTGGRPPVRGTGTSRSLIDDIPCNLLPTGCPAPIPMPGGARLDNYKLHAEWGVYESINGKWGAALNIDRDFLSPASQGPAQSFVLNALHTAEYGRAAPAPKRYLIVAMVSVTADKTLGGTPPSTTRVTSAPVPLEVPVSLSVLQVPTVFVLFKGKNFVEAAAIYFPSDSTFRLPSKDAQRRLLEVVSKLLNTYNSTASSLSRFAGMASFLTGLNVLQTTLSLPHVDVKELKDAESNLNNDDFIYKGPLAVNDKEVEDESSSLFLFGVQGTGAQFFQHRHFGGMKFMARTGPEMVVLIRDLAAMSRVEPAGRVSDMTFTTGATPNRSLSSFKWCRPECWRRPGS